MLKQYLQFQISNVLKYSKEHDKVYLPYIRKVNDILRDKAIQYGLLVVYADKFMPGEEDLFSDPVHVYKKEDMIKSYFVGYGILHDLNLPIQFIGDWKEIESWVNARRPVF